MVDTLIETPSGEPEPPYQSLYRRFRPGRFDGVRGQEHVVRALRNAVREERIAHAYLFSGPRGTGKTSTARILAKALNCTAVEDGEPCGVCPSCISIAEGSSLDVHELDAASNNGVEAIRDLVSRAALGTPGRWKVYIVDEVHMLSTAASNALLKTLEEPPGHVVFVLATTDPQKVLPTIRSRTQHYEFRLLGPEVLGELLRDVSERAGLGLPDQAVEVAVRRGRGSARDALSVLDQVAAATEVEDDLPQLREVVVALCEGDSGAALAAVARLVMAGWSPAQLAGDLVEHLRQGFLALTAPELVDVTSTERDDVAVQARALGLASLVRAMELLGRSQVEMRDAPDPRVHLEVALIRLTHPEMDETPAAVLARIERLEQAVGHTGSGDAPSAGAASLQPLDGPHGPSPRADTPAYTDGLADRTGPAMVRESLAAHRRSSIPAVGAAPTAPAPVGQDDPTPTDGPDERPPVAVSDERPPVAVSDERPPVAVSDERPPVAVSDERPPVAVSDERPPVAVSDERPPVAVSDERPPVAGLGGPAPSGAPGTSPPPGVSETLPATRFPSRDSLVREWGDHVLPGLRPKLKALYQAGRFVEVTDGVAVFALPNDTHRRRCEEIRAEVEAALSVRFGSPIPIRLTVEGGTGGEPRRPRGREPVVGRSASTGDVPESHRSTPAEGSDQDPSPSPAEGSDQHPSPSPSPLSSGAGDAVREPEAPAELHEEDDVDLSQLGDPLAGGVSPEDRLFEAFPGAEEVS